MDIIRRKEIMEKNDQLKVRQIEEHILIFFENNQIKHAAAMTALTNLLAQNMSLIKDKNFIDGCVEKLRKLAYLYIDMP
jgi:hypothetical protein